MSLVQWTTFCTNPGPSPFLLDTRDLPVKRGSTVGISTISAAHAPYSRDVRSMGSHRPLSRPTFSASESLYIRHTRGCRRRPAVLPSFPRDASSLDLNSNELEGRKSDSPEHSALRQHMILHMRGSWGGTSLRRFGRKNPDASWKARQYKYRFSRGN